ncbi:CsbD family protein [Mycolicibacterium sp. CBMA 226]|uniref:CsbD family protein n=1 Tax=Mycolicibacterium sp. CBMA 226 TaxID=2606611 RepID=UPI0012DCB567|nr:CsbD family protein [Mycolicibacterium sp. CBMA 226]MUL74573.1 CsbD family protein [Mycolicibacterium sp. CBMA 226]
MGQHEKADEARKGLIDSVKGKAKEIAGAVTGNDSLTAEGQLEQAEARARKEANAIEAVADAEAQSASDLLSQAHHQAAGARGVVRSSADVAKEAAQKQQVADVQQTAQAARHRAAEEQVRAAVEEQRAERQAEIRETVDTAEAGREAAEALAEHRSAMGEAAAEQAEARRLRERVETLTQQTDLP